MVTAKDTREVLGENGQHCKSRSLFASRLADARLKEGPKQAWIEQLCGIPPASEGSRFVFSPSHATTVYGQLLSRMMINSSGSVMENAGLSLDRYGLPFVPGSAVKGCCRRMAIQQVVDLHESQEATSAVIDSMVSLISDAALIFGWTEYDWKQRRNNRDELVSDFVFSVGDESWDMVFIKIEEALLEHLGCSRLPAAYAGTVSFLAAPVVQPPAIECLLTPPALGFLEMEVLTSHHQEYYGGRRKVAFDDEPPNPVFFPAVAAGQFFRFSLLPLARCNEGLMKQARAWLLEGLSVFGVGAKTSAGYGWFDTSDDLQAKIQDSLNKKAEREREEREREAEKQRDLEAEERRVAEKNRREARLSSMSPEEREDDKLNQMNRAQLLEWIVKFGSKTEGEKQAIYRFFHTRNPDLWKEIRTKGQQGKQKEKRRLGPIVEALFVMAKERGEKMPK